MLSTVLAASPVDPKSLLETFGVLGLFAIVFAETGLLVGFFLPGDSLLVLAGLVARSAPSRTSTSTSTSGVVLVGLFIAAVIGAQTGYFIGLKAGPRCSAGPTRGCSNRSTSTRRSTTSTSTARRRSSSRGSSRSCARSPTRWPASAEMPVRTFTIFNVIGAALWTVGVTMIGFVLGKTIPSAEDHLLVIEAIIIVLSLIPIAFEVVRRRRERARPTCTAEQRCVVMCAAHERHVARRGMVAGVGRQVVPARAAS